MYFSENKFAVEIDEKDILTEIKMKKTRETKIEKHSDYKFFHRINPDAEDFDIFLKLLKYGITLPNQMKKN